MFDNIGKIGSDHVRRVMTSSFLPPDIYGIQVIPIASRSCCPEETGKNDDLHAQKKWESPIRLMLDDNEAKIIQVQNPRL